MKALRIVSIRRPWTALGLFCLVLAATGCGSGFKTVPVSGKIFVNGEPLTGADATVLFRPDASKGNTLNVDFSGTADENGNYTLYYGGKGNQGVAPGWYKVAVVATEPPVFAKPDKKSKARMPGMPIPKSLIDKKYTVPANSGIEIQVVENPAPGAYDLKLTGPANK
jgi:hypothetical protein